jgi:glutamate dehydrogenase
LYVFTWLQRDELTTARRKAIAAMLEEAVGSPVTNWAIDLGDGELAMLRYTLTTQANTVLPDVEALDARLVEMVRGWSPAVEAELVELVGSGRATRLAMTYLPAIPEVYRARVAAAEAAEDILRLSRLGDHDERSVRLYRARTDKGAELHLKAYRRSSLIALSDAVPVLEHFGFRVIDENPTTLDNGHGHIHNFHLSLPGSDALDSILLRSATIEAAIAQVLSGQAEDDEFNQLVLLAGLEPRAVVWLRAWFR